MVGRDCSILVLAGAILLSGEAAAWTLDASLYGGLAENGKLSNIRWASDPKIRFGDLALSPSGLVGGRLELANGWYGVALDAFYQQVNIPPQTAWTGQQADNTAQPWVTKGWPGQAIVVSPLVMAHPFTLTLPEGLGARSLTPYVGVGPALVFSKQCDHLSCTNNTTLGFRFVGGVKVNLTDRLGVFLEGGHWHSRIACGDLEGSFCGDVAVGHVAAGISWRLAP